jgi:type IV secretory pathway protease TraF
VIGDFSLRSTDSRSWGPVPRRNIEGVVSFVYFPFYRWRLVK